MSGEYLKEAPCCKKCNACDFQKLKQLENNPVVRKLQDKIEQLSFRLTECKNENQMLKRNIQLARKMVCQEVGGQDIDFQALMKHGTEAGSKGRQENVLVLKTKVQKLQDYLRELEGDSNTSQETQLAELAKYQMPNDRKRLWRMELERRLAREDAAKDINPLVQECFELRRNLLGEKNRFKELSEEVKLLKIELQSQVEKNEEDFGIVNSFKTLESQLEQTLAERAEIRRDLQGSRTRNKRLVEEISLLKEELQSLQKKTNDNNVLIESLTNSRKNIEEAIDAEKIIVQQNIERYKEELKVLQENHVTDSELLNHLQCIIYDRNELIDQIDKDADACFKKNYDKKEKTQRSNFPEKLPDKEQKTMPASASKNKLPKEVIDDTPEEPREDQVNTDAETRVRRLRLECTKYKVLCDAVKMEGDRLSHLIANQDQKMNEVAVQVIETGSLIMRKNAEKKEMIEKVNRLQRSFSNRRKKGTFHVQSKSKFDELRLKCDMQREENDFLRNFLRSAVCSKAKDLLQLKDFITESRNFLETLLKETKESKPLTQSNNLATVESTTNANN